VKDGHPNALTFGIYPGSAIGDTELTGPPDRPDKINQALARLQGSPGRPFIVRAYEAYADAGDTVHTATSQTPAGYDRYLGHGRMLDLVAQIAEEPNISGHPKLDGAYPRIADALIAGVRAAKDKAGRRGLAGMKVGCNSSPLLGPDGTFFVNLTRAGGEQFIADLDYIGLDFFPDVFRPIAPASLVTAVQGLLAAHRRDNLATAGLGHLPLVITEHGWPTGPGRTPQRQAEVLRTVIDVVSRNAGELGITGYIHHTLRDSCSAGSGLFSQFGLMTDDYTPKPAFHVYQDLIDTLSRLMLDQAADRDGSDMPGCRKGLCQGEANVDQR
jgi:hypothetical protein